MLIENELWGQRNKVDIAIERIKMFEKIAIEKHPNGFYVCISGGKDSSVIQHLCITAKIKCEFVHNLTSVDHPETIYFIRKEKKDTENLGYQFTIQVPKRRDGTQRTMWNGIITKGLPTMFRRWCCEKLKETGGLGRYCITGVRWAESNKRSDSRKLHEIYAKTEKEKIMLNNDNEFMRKINEMCIPKNKLILNPIIDWSDSEVWEYIKYYQVKVNPLYKKGYKRIGCIGCPMNTNFQKELDEMPKYKALYRRSAERYINRRYELGLQMTPYMLSGETYFNNWFNKMYFSNRNCFA